MKLNIRDEMNRQKISGPRLAEMTGIKYRTLDEFLRRESGNFTHLVKIADALGVSIDSLVGRDGEDTLFDHPATAPPDGEPDEEDLISEMSDYEVYRMTKEMELKYKEQHPDLSQQSSKICKNLKFKADIEHAESFIHEDRQRALELYSLAFLTASADDMGAFRKSHIETLANLCEEFGDSAVIAGIVEKYTSMKYSKNGNQLIVFANILADYGFTDEAADMMKAVL